MYKISVNNFLGRILFLVLASFPLVLYFSLVTLLSWNIRFNLGIIIYCCFSLSFFLIFIKYCCFDWDFYVFKGKGFLFERLGKVKVISEEINFEVKPILIISFYLNVFLIKFQNGEKFFFRYNKYNMPLMSFDRVISDIEGVIKAKI